jgi:cyanophycinase-like exopeptidase
MKKRKGPDPFLQTIIRRTGIGRPAIAYVGTASGDDDAFRLWLTRLFQKAGAGEVMLAPLCGRRGDPKKAKTVLAASDLVFISGGDVDEGMRVLEEKNMTGFLRRLNRSGKLFFGISAGSIMISRKFIRWRNSQDDDSAELFPCLGLVPILCDTHGEADGWEELKSLLKLSPISAIGYGIVTGTGIVVEPDGTISALGGEVDRFRKRAGGVDKIESLFPNKNAQW